MHITIRYQRTCAAFKRNRELVSQYHPTDDMCRLLWAHIRLCIIHILCKDIDLPESSLLLSRPIATQGVMSRKVECVSGKSGDRALLVPDSERVGTRQGRFGPNCQQKQVTGRQK